MLAELIHVPAALIMRVTEGYIEVFRTSASEKNPYKLHEGEHFHRKCGLYCETVIRKKQKLLVPNALDDPEWNKNPDIKLGMISYLGYPIEYPDEKVFGTLCVLDEKENHYSSVMSSTLERLKDIIEAHIALLSKNEELISALASVKTLSGLLPICANCKKNS